MTIKNDMDRLQYRKGGLIKLLLKKGDTLFSIARENELSIAGGCFDLPTSELWAQHASAAPSSCLSPAQNTNVNHGDPSLLTLLI